MAGLTKLTRVTSRLVTFMVRKLHDKLRDTLSILDYEKTGTEQDRWIAAITDLQSKGGGTLLVPAGTYTFTGPVSASLTTRVCIKFQPGASLNQTVDSHLFNFTSTSGGSLDVQGPGVITALFSAKSASSAAIKFVGTGRVRSFICTGSLEIHADETTVSQFKYGMHLTDVQDGVIRDTLFSALQGTYFGTALYITAVNGASVSWTIDGIDSYNHEVDIDVAGTRSPGVEGIKLINCDLVSSKHGFRWINTASYVPPQLEMVGCHVNTKSAGVILTNVMQIHVSGGLFYRSITTVLDPADIARGFFEFNNAQDWSIMGASMSVVHSSINVPAILINGTTNAFGRIDGTHFWMNGRDKAFIKIIGSITRLQLGSGCTKDTSGQWIDLSEFTGNHGQIQISDDIRLTALDLSTIGNVFVDASSGTVDLRPVKRGILTLDNVTESSVVTAFQSPEIGRVYTIVCSTAGVTIQRNSGILLRDTGNFIFHQAGETLTIVVTADGIVRELARSNPLNFRGSLAATTTTPSIAAGASAMVATGTITGMKVTDGFVFKTSDAYTGFILSVVKTGASTFQVYATNVTAGALTFPSLTITVRAANF
ncbi:hypothetical protein [Ralstonia phage Reminis]|uniref:Pectate lyase superfamily protein domain-containing protein n=1 Tax=Ralstonia phage Reminis TaxID=2662139 RepID=A0A5Q2U8L5_9CAUD|nr:hypothetical protein [Ralstonia phage Reminis]